MKMDRTTIIGFISLIVLVVYGYMEGGDTKNYF